MKCVPGMWIFQDCIRSNIVYLRPLTIVFVFTRKVFAFEAIKNFRDRFRRLGKHRLEWYTWLQLAILLEVEDTVLEHGRNDDFVRWKLAEVD